MAVTTMFWRYGLRLRSSFNMAGHAAVGCLSAMASGGKCGPGALSGAAGSFAGPLLTGLGKTEGLVAHSLVGGLASVAGGGKFGNGAVTAAFGYLFNMFAQGGAVLGAVGGRSLGAVCGPGALVCGWVAGRIGSWALESLGTVVDDWIWPDEETTLEMGGPRGRGPRTQAQDPNCDNCGKHGGGSMPNPNSSDPKKNLCPDCAGKPPYDYNYKDPVSRKWWRGEE